jgi:hypothetical protein
MLGKRTKPEHLSSVADEDNPVASVDFISVSSLEPKKAPKRVVIEERPSSRQTEDPEALPLSIKERFASNKHRDMKPTTAHSSEETKDPVPKAPSTTKNWSAIYGEASKQISSLIDRQSQMLQGKADAKKESKGGKQRQGDKHQKEKKKPKYYLGSSIAGEKKFNAF